MPLPKFSRTLTDGNLERAEQSGLFNKHVVIIGTAADGPMYTPVTIRDLDHAESLFGAFGTGTLIRALNECWQAQATRGKAPLISAVRVGGAVASRSSLSLDSNDSNDGVAFILTAFYPGEEYNGISVLQDQANEEFKIYNPKTELWSSFKYDWDNPNNPSVDAHNTVELVAAINADTNMRDILVASVPDKTAKFELLLNTTDDADIVVSSSNIETKLDISNVGTGDYINSTLFIDGTDVSGDTPSDWTTKPIVAVTKIYSIGDSGLELFKGGSTTVKALQMPLSGRSDTRFNTLLNVISDEAVLQTLAQDPGSGDLTSEGYFRVRGLTIGKFDTDSRSITFATEFGIADYAASASGLVGPALVASSYHSDKGFDADYSIANLGGGFKDTIRWNATGVETVGGAYPIKVEMRKATAAANAWDVMDLSKGTWVLSWASDVLTLIIPADLAGTVDLADYDEGDIRVSYDSCIGIFTEKSTLAGVTSTSAVFTDYFVRGNEFVFGGTLPQNTVFRYARIIEYELGANVTITDAVNGLLTISGADIQPGPGGDAIGADDVIIGFEYNYAPTAPVLTSAKTLAGGSNGTSMTNLQLYADLEVAFDNLDAFTFSILTIPGAYIDSTKTGYNANTGLAETLNADFHGLVKTFLEGHNSESEAVMAFVPIVGTGINSSITRANVASRALKLTTVDFSDNLRAANYFDSFDSKQIVAIDLEGYFLGKGTRYLNTGESAVAGHMAMLRDEETLYLESINGILSLRYAYSDKMTTGMTQLDALSNARINGAKSEAAGVRLVDGITAAADTSDYHLEATLRAVLGAVRDVRKIASTYLGKPNNLQTLQSLETGIDRVLSARVPTSLVAFNFTVKSSPGQRVIGQIEIPLTLVPVFEIRDIQVPVILRSEATSS